MNKVDLLDELGFDDLLIFTNPEFESAICGVSVDGRVMYDYELMVEDMMRNDGISREDAIDYIEYNTIRSLGYMGPDAPIVFHRLEGE